MRRRKGRGVGRVRVRGENQTWSALGPEKEKKEKKRKKSKKYAKSVQEGLGLIE